MASIIGRADRPPSPRGVLQGTGATIGADGGHEPEVRWVVKSHFNKVALASIRPGPSGTSPRRRNRSAEAKGDPWGIVRVATKPPGEIRRSAQSRAAVLLAR